MKTNQKERYSIIKPLKTAGLSFNEARNLGFRVGRRLWLTCHNETKRNNGI